MENLKKLAGLTDSIKATLKADYHFRLTVTAAELSRIMNALANTVVYPNFKARIASRPDQSQRSEIYHRIWAESSKLLSN